MYKKIVILGLVSCLSVFNLAHAKDDIDDLRDNDSTEWSLVKHDVKRQIKAYDKKEYGNRLRSFKLDAVIDAPLETVARVYYDIENYHKWFWQVSSPKILKRVSDTEFYYYLEHGAPVGLPDRDVIIHAQIIPHSRNHPYIEFKLKAVPDFIAPKPPLVRMVAEDMTLKWTPIDKNTTRLETEGYIDPGGVIPSWAITAVQRQAPYYTMLGLQRMVKQPQYLNPTTSSPFKVYGID